MLAVGLAAESRWMGSSAPVYESQESQTPRIPSSGKEWGSTSSLLALTHQRLHDGLNDH